jgi:hypothetical protein
MRVSNPGLPRLTVISMPNITMTPTQEGAKTKTRIFISSNKIEMIVDPLDLEHSIRHPRIVGFLSTFFVALAQIKGIAIGDQMSSKRRFDRILHPLNRKKAARAGNASCQVEVLVIQKHFAPARIGQHIAA